MFLTVIRNSQRHYHGKYFLAVLDAYSKWLEAFETLPTSTNLAIKVFISVFSKFEILKIIVSENGS